MVAIPQVITSDSASGAQVIDGSLKFDSTKSTKLARTPGSAGNRKTWTWSAWIKRSDFAEEGLFGAGTNGNQIFFGGFAHTDDKFYIHNGVQGSSVENWANTTAVYRDTGWYHVVLAMDTTQSTASDRTKLYINGSQQDLNDYSSGGFYPSLNYDTAINNTVVHNLGYSHTNSSAYYFDGHLLNAYLIDGLALGPEYFGFTDPLTNIWKPKKFKAEGTTYNNGTVWSSGSTVTGGSISNAADGFDGDLSSSGAHCTLTSTDSSTTANVKFDVSFKNVTKVEVFVHSASSSGDTRGTCETPNGVTFTSPTLTSASQSFHTIYEGEPIRLKNIGWGINQNGQTGTSSDAFRAFRINGEILIDSTTRNLDFGTNGFYLPMDGNSPIGQDKSGKGNDWTPVNFGGSVAIDNPQVSGARPVLNTTQGGTQATVGVFGSKENKYYTVTTANGSVYQFDITSGDNPSLEFIRGATYKFDYSSHTGHPVLFSSSNPDSSTTAYTTGTSIASNVISFTVPHDAPDTLYYYCQNHPTGMNGAISITTDNTKADQYASNCVFALPIVGNANDVSASIACTMSNASITNSGVDFVSSYSNFYSGSGDFTGATTDVLSTGDEDTKFKMEEGDFTIECWVYSTSTSGTQNICQIIGDSSSKYYGIYYSSSALKFQMAGTGGAQADAGDVVFGKNKWYHIAMVRNGSTLKGYIDGVEEATAGSISSDMDETGYQAFVGRHSPTNNGFTGYIQDFRVYRGVAKYTSNFVVPATSPDILPDTPSGVSGSSKLTKITDGAVSFDGSGDGLTLATSSDFTFGSVDFTIEMIIYPTEASGSKILFENDSSGNGNGVILARNSSQQIFFYVNGNGAYISSQLAPNKVWTHVALVRDGTAGTTKIYINGVGDTSNSNDAGTTNDGVFIGSRNSGASLVFGGLISNVRVLKGTALYTKNFTPPTAPLTNVTNTKLLCCQSNLTSGAAAVSPNISGINNGTVWSSGAGPNFDSANPAVDGFNGDADDFTRTDNANVTATVTLPSSVAFSSTLKVRGARDSGNGTISLTGANGTIDVSSQFTSSSATLETVTITGVTSPLSAISLTGISGSAQPRFSAIYIDDVMLVDPVATHGDAAATNFNPFNTDIDTVRGQETGYATLNPLFQNPNGNTTSDGNLTQSTTAGNGHYRANFNIGASSGKFYFEYIPTGGAVTGMVGLCEENHGAGSNLNGTTAYSYYGVTGNKQGGPSAVDTAYGTGFTFGDVIGVAFDSDNNTLEYFKNGVSEGVAFTSFPNYPYYPAFSAGSSSNTVTYNVNFGQKPFKFPPPDGFQPLNAANTRPVKVIPRSDQYVGVTTYTGTTGAGTIKDDNIKFTPDFVWLKSRSNSEGHALYDTVRGSTGGNFYRLRSDTTAAQNSPTNELSSMIEGGFTVNNNGHCYYNGYTYVAWCWRAGGSKNTFNVDDVGYASASNVNMSVSSLNSTIYNTSNRWSDDYSGAAIDGSYPITQAFDGNRTTAARVNATETVMSVDLTSITVTNKIEVLGELGFNTPNVSVTVGGFTHNIGGDPSTAVSGTSGTTTKTITGVSGALTNVTVGKVSSGRSYLSQIIVDGKILVDDNITPPNAPSIAATGCSVGTKQGFSIIKYQGNGTSGATVPHGLNEPVDLILFKSLGRSDNWRVYHSAVGGDKALFLSTTGAEDDNAVYFNDTTPTSSVFSLGTDSGVNTNSDNVIAYCWHNVSGLQKFGSFIGNANADGPFIELGFRPSVIIIKRSDGGSENWTLWDAARNPHNVMGKQLYPNSSAAEADAGTNSAYGILDFVSNGVKIRGSHTSFNSSGHTFIYAAWAEAPTVNLFGGSSNAR